MSSAWPALDYDRWSATCDTLHAHTQVLGKLAAKMAPPEPELQHAALRLTARGWETIPLPAGDGALVIALDLRTHEAVVEHTSGTAARVPLGPDRAVGPVTRAVVAAVRGLAGDVEFDPTPQEVAWTAPLDADEEHATYNAEHVAEYFAAATSVARVLAAFRAPYRGRSTPVNAWWGSFDLSVSLFSGAEAEPPSGDFIMRNAMDAQEVAVGWGPGDPRDRKPGFYAYTHPACPPFNASKPDPPAARFDEQLGEFVLDWSDVVAAEDPHATALGFARSAFSHACIAAEGDPKLLASAQGTPPAMK
jgi:hypothetical protein